MADIIRLPEEGEEPSAIICEVCANNWDLLSAHFFVHEDGSFRCVNCAQSYVFTNNHTNGQKK